MMRDIREIINDIKTVRNDIWTKQTMFDMDLDIITDFYVIGGHDMSDMESRKLLFKKCEKPFDMVMGLGQAPPRERRVPTSVYNTTVCELLLQTIINGDCHHVLADALEDAGSIDLELLSHLRQGAHMPICYAISELTDDLPMFE